MRNQGSKRPQVLEVIVVFDFSNNHTSQQRETKRISK
jgi:hypothetical protein